MTLQFHRAVFLDRDGVLMQDANYVGDLNRVVLIPGAPQALKRLRDAGYRLFVVTNQSGVARGFFSREAVEQVHAYLDEQFAQDGIVLDRYYVCPHHSEENCDCRKPKPKFLLEAAREYRLDLSQCYMIGDRPTDIQAGQNAGTRTILVLTGAGKETLEKSKVRADDTVQDIGAAADCILRSPKK